MNDKKEVFQNLITVGDWIRYAASRFGEAELFFGHGYESAWDEAVQLVLTCLHLPSNLPKEILQSQLLLDERKQLFEAVEQRIITRLPLAYILHEAWFCGLPFYVDKRVLIPRSPIAELIQKQFEPWLNPEKVDRILDIGTGSGCIAIAAAMIFSESKVDAVDINQEALAVALINVGRYQLADRVTLLQSDCFSGLNGKKYDLIISNPPYVSAEEFVTLPPEYQHEPKGALLAEKEGMAIVEKILDQAVNHLTDEGILVIEVGYSKDIMTEHFPNLPLLWLDLEKGGEGVFLVTAQQLKDYQNDHREGKCGN